MKVVEISQGLSAKLLGKYLCDIGWQVVVFESTGEYASPYPNWDRIKSQLNLGKRVISYSELPKELSAADAIIEDTKLMMLNVPPSVLSKVVHLCLTPYASEDTDHSSFCGQEAAIMAASGVFTDMGMNRTLLGIRASFSHLPLASVYGAMFGLCALLSEIVQGRTGSYVEIPLASALTEALVHNSIVFPVDHTYVSRRKQCVLKKKYPIDAVTLDALFDPFFTLYTCQDGKKIYLVCPAHRRHQLDGLKTLNVTENVLAIVDIVNTYAINAALGIGSGNLSDDQSHRVRRILQDAYSGRIFSMSARRSANSFR